MSLKPVNPFLFLGICFLTFVSLPQILFAEVVINEIMYDLPGSDDKREWIEIYNSNSLAVNLEGFNLETSSNHRPFISVSGSFVLAPEDWALIVQNYDEFKKDHPNFSGTVFQSSFSLGNTTGKIILKIKDTAVDEMKYNSLLGAKGDGNSLQKFTNEILTSKPTPGQQNQVSNQATQPTGKDATEESPEILPATKEEIRKNTEIKKESGTNIVAEEAGETEKEATTPIAGNIIEENNAGKSPLAKWIGILCGLLVVSILPIIFSSGPKKIDEIKIIIEEE